MSEEPYYEKHERERRQKWRALPDLEKTINILMIDNIPVIHATKSLWPECDAPGTIMFGELSLLNGDKYVTEFTVNDFVLQKPVISITNTEYTFCQKCADSLAKDFDICGTCARDPHYKSEKC